MAVWCLAGLAAGCSGGKEANRPAPGAGSGSAGQAGRNPVVVIETSMGTIRAELWADRAPATAANFLRYVEEGHYDGLVFHRVMDGFMIQGGGMRADGSARRTHPPIRNEARADLRNDRGTLAMARTNEPHSATSQFFINLKNNDGLNHKAPTVEDYGYCAFGRVIEGMDVVDRIAKAPVRPDARGERSVPVEVIEIHSIRRAGAGG